jgi:hypothetical protein
MRPDKLAQLCLAFGFIILSPVPAVAQREVIGDWQGVLKDNQTKGLKIRLVVHIISAPDGNLTATIDSIDQDSPAIAVASVTFSNSSIKLDVSQVQATFDGLLNKEGTEIVGTWTEGKPQTLKLKRVTNPKKWAAPIPIGGEWQGQLNFGGRQFDLSLHIDTTHHSRPVATIDGVDQGEHGIDKFVLKDNVLKFTVDGVGARYTGTISDDGNAIQGIWKERQESPLNFHRAVSTTKPVSESQPVQNPSN